MKFTQITRLGLITSEAMKPLIRILFRGGRTRWYQMFSFLEITELNLKGRECTEPRVRIVKAFW